MSRLGRTFKGGRSSIKPFYSATCFYNRKLGASDTLAADQTAAGSMANQIQYGRQSGYTFQNYSGIGYGGYQWPSSIAMNLASFSHPVWCVTNKDAKQYVAQYVYGGNYARGALNSNLQSFTTAVPIPDKTKCPMITGSDPWADIWAGGSDKSCCIWNRDTDEMWEFWVLLNNDTTAQANCLSYAQTTYGVNSITWTAGYGGYIPSCSTFNGVLPNGWGSRACSLGEVGGLITLQDLRDVYAGGTINHAIAIAGVNCGGSVAPATRGDGTGTGNGVSVIPTGYPGAGGANPAYGLDLVTEGQRFRFPSSLDPDGYSQYPVAREITRAIRDYGLVLVDGAGTCALYIEDARTLGSPYHLQGATASNPDPLIAQPLPGVVTLDWSMVQPPANSGTTDPRYRADGTTVLCDVPWGQLQLLSPIVS